MNNNNETGIIKGRIDAKLSDALKIILSKLNMTQQDLIDKKIKEFVIENINLVISSNDSKSGK